MAASNVDRRQMVSKAIAVLGWVVVIGYPWGLYSRRVIEDARTMTQEQWLAHMEMEQTLAANSVGLLGTMLYCLVIMVALATIYEFTWRGVEMVLRKVWPADAAGARHASEDGL